MHTWALAWLGLNVAWRKSSPDAQQWCNQQAGGGGGSMWTHCIYRKCYPGQDANLENLEERSFLNYITCIFFYYILNWTVNVTCFIWITYVNLACSRSKICEYFWSFSIMVIFYMFFLTIYPCPQHSISRPIRCKQKPWIDHIICLYFTCAPRTMRIYVIK